MMANPANREDSQFDALTARLINRYSGRIPEARVRLEVAESRDEFVGAHIRTYVPILAGREAARRLNDYAHLPATG